jgi:DNA-directed RNA polymerase specialized sigma subunit
MIFPNRLRAKDVVHELVDAYKQGYTLKEICEEYPISRATIYRYIAPFITQEVRKEHLKNRGIRQGCNNLVRLTEIEKDIIMSDYNSRMTGNCIAKKYNISRATLYRIIAERKRLMTNG